MVDLHRINRLRKVAGVALDVDAISNGQGAVGQIDGVVPITDADLAEQLADWKLVRYGDDLWLLMPAADWADITRYCEVDEQRNTFKFANVTGKLVTDPKDMITIYSAGTELICVIDIFIRDVISSCHNLTNNLCVPQIWVIGFNKSSKSGYQWTRHRSSD